MQLDSDLLARAFAHREMRVASEQVSRRRLPNGLQAALHPHGLPEELVLVAEMFCRLQHHRQAADYDLGARFKRMDVLDLVRHVGAAARALASVRRHPATRVYLTALLAGTRWTR
jgi:hypothetical protein